MIRLYPVMMRIGCVTVDARHHFVYALMIFLLLITTVAADVVKPALVEITVRAKGEIHIEIRASLEAMLTGINAQYKNTQDSPQAEAYDALRILSAEQLERAFTPFQTQFLEQVELRADNQLVPLNIEQVQIPEPGYPKVPRASVIVLSGSIARDVQSLQWYYPAAFGDNAVRVRQVNQQKEQWHWSAWQWIRTDQPSQPFSLTEVFYQASTWDVVQSYLRIGFAHILPKGLDHILFIIGLFLFSHRLRPLLLQVTMFTIAHTITLGLSMNGVISLPALIVEPLIALSIAYIGIENVCANKLHKHRLLLVFIFGLLHGLGFAGVLADFGMPSEAFAVALISFNIGVEAGQLTIILIGYLLLSKWLGQPVRYRSRVAIPGSLLIAAIGLYWTLERLLLV